MLRKTLIAALLTLATASPALAFHCPADMAKIDAKLAQNPPLSAEQKAEVTGLRAEGEALHNAGKHAEAVKVLAEAMRLLGIR